MIERMLKILVAGPEDIKESILAQIQNIGVIQADSYKGDEFAVDGRELQTIEAEKALSAYKTLVRYEREFGLTGIKAQPSQMPAKKIIAEIEELDNTLKNLLEQRHQFNKKLEDIAPWGRFSLELIKELERDGGVSAQFWQIPLKLEGNIGESGALSFVETSRDSRRVFMLSFAANPIEIKGCAEVRYDLDADSVEKKTAEIKERIEKTKQEITALIQLKNSVFKEYLAELGKSSLIAAASGTVKAAQGAAFTLCGWCPESRLEELNKSLKEMPVMVMPIEPEKGERIPTLMNNSSVGAMGEDLVKIYDTPAYRDWDPSAWVFFSFVVFFAMIFGDAGYASVLLAILLTVKLKLKNPRPVISRLLNMSIIIGAATFLYGLASGGFFGFAETNPFFGWLVKLKLFDSGNISSMMLTSIFIGMIHISISLVLKSARQIREFRDYSGAAPNIAWIPAIWSFYFWYSQKSAAPAQAETAFYVMLGSLGVVFISSGWSLNPLKLVLKGLRGLYNGVQFLADILSYIRIFALALSGSLIAATFNSLALQLWEQGGVLLLLSIVVFLCGHGLNFGLGIMGGVIHGLRLNFLEYYRWSFDGGGKPFKPFKNYYLD